MILVVMLWLKTNRNRISTSDSSRDFIRDHSRSLRWPLKCQLFGGQSSLTFLFLAFSKMQQKDQYRKKLQPCWHTTVFHAKDCQVRLGRSLLEWNWHIINRGLQMYLAEYTAAILHRSQSQESAESGQQGLHIFKYILSWGGGREKWE